MDALLEQARRQARRDNRPAMIRGNEAWLRSSLIDAATSLAGQHKREHTPGAPLLLRIPDGPALAVGLLSALELGAQTILVDGATPIEECLRIAGAFGATSIMTSESADRLDAATFQWRGLPENSRPDWAETERAGIVKMTSGSTGAPCGIQLTTDVLLADDRQLRQSMGLKPEDRALAAIPLTHSYGLSSLLVPCLVAGLPLIFADAPLPFRALVAAREHDATWFPSVPAALAAFARHGRDQVAWPESIRTVQSAGALLAAEDAVRFREVFGLSIHVFYGSSETGGICYDRVGGAAERGTVGTPIEGVQIELDDTNGRVTVRSLAVADRIVPEPSANLASGRAQLGDLGCFHDEELRLLGRVDARIHLKGKKIDAAEVEAVLCGMDGVTEAAVFLAETPIGPQLRAVIACRRSIDVKDIRRSCREHLAEFKRPRSLIVIPELPHTPRGKLDRAALHALVPQWEI